MELLLPFASAALTFGWGFMAGRLTAKRNPRAEMLDDIFIRAVEDNRNFEKFAAINSRAMARVIDEQGKTWVISIEKEQA